MTKVSREISDTSLRRKINGLAGSVGMTRPGGAAFSAIVARAVKDRQLTLFVPWAAPRGGGKRGRSSSFAPEERTLQWLTGVREALGELVNTKLVVMFADTYASRNGYDKGSADEYFRTIGDMVTATGEGATTLRASQVENDPLYQGFLRREAYGLARLAPATQQIVIGNAARYTGLTESEAYEAAADYTARRRAESLWVVGRLGALTITLNGSNGNAALEGIDTAMVYAPIEVRTPWLKEG